MRKHTSQCGYPAVPVLSASGRSLTRHSLRLDSCGDIVDSPFFQVHNVHDVGEKQSNRRAPLGDLVNVHVTLTDDRIGSGHVAGVQLPVTEILQQGIRSVNSFQVLFRLRVRFDRFVHPRGCSGAHALELRSAPFQKRGIRTL